MLFLPLYRRNWFTFHMTICTSCMIPTFNHTKQFLKLCDTFNKIWQCFEAVEFFSAPRRSRNWFAIAKFFTSNWCALKILLKITILAEIWLYFGTGVMTGGMFIVSSIVAQDKIFALVFHLVSSEFRKSVENFTIKN